MIILAHHQPHLNHHNQHQHSPLNSLWIPTHIPFNFHLQCQHPFSSLCCYYSSTQHYLHHLSSSSRSRSIITLYKFFSSSFSAAHQHLFSSLICLCTSTTSLPALLFLLAVNLLLLQAVQSLLLLPQKSIITICFIVFIFFFHCSVLVCFSLLLLNRSFPSGLSTSQLPLLPLIDRFLLLLHLIGSSWTVATRIGFTSPSVCSWCLVQSLMPPWLFGADVGVDLLRMSSPSGSSSSSIHHLLFFHLPLAVDVELCSCFCFRKLNLR